MQLRNLPDDFEKRGLKFRTAQSMTLILITEAGEILFENSSPLQKDELMKLYGGDGSGDVMLLAWNGQYKTDIFELTDEDLRKHYK